MLKKISCNGKSLCYMMYAGVKTTQETSFINHCRPYKFAFKSIRPFLSCLGLSRATNFKHLATAKNAFSVVIAADIKFDSSLYLENHKKTCTLSDQSWQFPFLVSSCLRTLEMIHFPDWMIFLVWNQNQRIQVSTVVKLTVETGSTKWNSCKVTAFSHGNYEMFCRAFLFPWNADHLCMIYTQVVICWSPPTFRSSLVRVHNLKTSSCKLFCNSDIAHSSMAPLNYFFTIP
jgi:hypothetical protein